jgi:hypothetical protein
MEIPEIRFLAHHEIDKQKWDTCVQQAPNGFIYALSFFLDGLCNWDALVMGDYEYVMPLPRRRKYGFHYIYTPPFTGQLGIVGPLPVTPQYIDAFILSIPRSFSYIDLLMNEENDLADTVVHSRIRKVNLVLPLTDPYRQLCSRYSRDARKNLRRADAFNLAVKKDINPSLVLKLYKEAYGQKLHGLNEITYEQIRQVMKVAIKKEMGFTVGVYKGNDLVGAGFFGKDDKRIYYLMGAPSTAGRGMKAIHVLVDSVIREYSNSGLMFDFEGSDIPNVYNFYMKFSPETKYYAHLKINRLPFFLRWLKS